MAAIIDFGTFHLFKTGIGAGVGAAAGATLGAISRVGASVGASIGAGIGAIEVFATFPVDIAAEVLTKEYVFVYNPGGPAIEKLQFKSRGHEALCHIIIAINHVVVKAALWGGAALLGIVSLPAAAVIGGGGALYFAASKLETLLLILSPKSLRPVAALASLALKVAVVAGVLFAVIQLGLLAPPWAIALGVSAAVLALMGTGFSFLSIYKDEFKALTDKRK
jgi:hypothetical protein